MLAFDVDDTVKCINETTTAFNCEGRIVDIVNQGVLVGQEVAYLRVIITVGNDLYPVGSSTCWYSEMVEKV